ncbi:MAG: hypothetical protein WD135_02525 [Ferruginibacter sp.]
MEALNNKVRLISYLKVRQTIGVLAILMPIVFVLNSFYCGTLIKPSISHYYYTNMGDIFVGLLFGIAMFLFTYKGYEKKDDFITNAASIAAICIAIFPTSYHVETACAECSEISFLKNYHGMIHNISAAVFFSLLAIYTFWFFPKSEKAGPRQKYRNILYKVCGAGMMVSLMIVVLMERADLSIFWPESACMMLFGIAWIVKGNMFFAAK